MRRMRAVAVGVLLLNVGYFSGNVDAVALPVPPDPPTGLTATPVLAGASLSWQPPVVEGDAAVTDYTVTVWSAATDGAVVAQCSSVAPSTSCEVGSLANGVEYFADVVASSSAGTSVPSAPRVRTVSQWSLTSTPIPVIAGIAKIGQKLTASAGAWEPAPVSLAFQWLRSGVAVPGATAATFTLTASDVGKRMSVRVTGSKNGFPTVVQTSALTATVIGLNLTGAPTPVVTGFPAYGQRLTAVPGTWSPAPVALRYAWLRNGVAITGATGASYVLTVADIGKRMSVRVTGVKLGYQPLSRTSAQTAAIVPLALTPTPTPLVVGSPKVGVRLAARAGTWGPAPVTLSYAWLKNGVPITGATQSTYLIGPNDNGARISVRVIGSRPGYRSIAKYSAATAPVTVLVRIPSDGTRVVGTQVAAGTYVTVSKSVSSCYWERVSGFGGTFDEILANDFGSGQRIVTALPTDRGLTTERCGSWYRLADIPVAQRTSISGVGIWSVAKQIKPGTYRANGTGTCYWARLSGFSGNLADIITNDITSSPGSVVTISASDVGFETTAGCGSWTRIG